MILVLVAVGSVFALPIWLNLFDFFSGFWFRAELVKGLFLTRFFFFYRRCLNFLFGDVFQVLLRDNLFFFRCLFPFTDFLLELLLLSWSLPFFGARLSPSALSLLFPVVAPNFHPFHFRLMQDPLVPRELHINFVGDRLGLDPAAVTFPALISDEEPLVDYPCVLPLHI